jgi:hypothetical protein
VDLNLFFLLFHKEAVIKNYFPLFCELLCVWMSVYSIQVAMGWNEIIMIMNIIYLFFSFLPIKGNRFLCVCTVLCLFLNLIKISFIILENYFGRKKMMKLNFFCDEIFVSTKEKCDKKNVWITLSTKIHADEFFALLSYFTCSTHIT